jgi:hypothetical protein
MIASNNYLINVYVVNPFFMRFLDFFRNLIKTVDRSFDSDRMEKISNEIKGEVSWEYLIF